MMNNAAMELTVLAPLLVLHVIVMQPTLEIDKDFFSIVKA